MNSVNFFRKHTRLSGALFYLVFVLVVLSQYFFISAFIDEQFIYQALWIGPIGVNVTIIVMVLFFQKFFAEPADRVNILEFFSFVKYTNIALLILHSTVGIPAKKGMGTPPLWLESSNVAIIAILLYIAMILISILIMVSNKERVEKIEAIREREQKGLRRIKRRRKRK